MEWKEARERLLAAEAAQKNPATRSRILLICSSDRNDGTCPGEISKTFRLTQLARDVLAADGIDVDLLDLSRLISDYDWHIHPCKGCVSTAMRLCHWPGSCYPNHALRQTNDWMGLVDAGSLSRIDRYSGYYESYAQSYETLDRDMVVQEQVRNVARAVANAVRELREGRLSRPDSGLTPPRPK